MGAGLVMVSACSSPTPEVSTTKSSVSQLFTLEPTQDRKALQRTAQGYLATLLADPANQEVTLVKLDPAVVNDKTRDLAMTLPDGKLAQFHLRDYNTITSGIDGWVGYKPSEFKAAHPSSVSEIDIDPRYYLSLAREGEKVVGTLLIEGQPYRIAYVSPGQHVLIKVDESKLPPDGEPVVDSRAAVKDSTKGKVAASAHSIIRVLFVTTNQARESISAPRLELANALNNANQYMKNSQVEITYELAGFFDADYDQTGKKYWEQATDIRSDRAVSAARDALGADMVNILSTKNELCGQAYLESIKATAYSIVSCSTALAHELGHNIGALHGHHESSPIPEYAYGYRDDVGGFHTHMNTSHGAIPYFANPNLQYNRRPLGDARLHDVARRFNERRETVENFYPPYLNQTRVTVYDDVAMKGDSCTFEVPSTQSVVLIDDVCPGGWKARIWSARVQGIGANTTLRLGNEVASHTYSSSHYVGDFDVPTLTAVRLDLPDGMTMEPGSGNLTKRIDRLTILR